MRTAEGRRGFGELQISYSTRHTQHPYQGVGLRGHLSHRAAAPSTCSGKTLFAKFPFPSFRRSVTFNSIQSVFPQFSASPQRYERTCGPNGECPPPRPLNPRATRETVPTHRLSTAPSDGVCIGPPLWRCDGGPREMEGRGDGSTLSPAQSEATSMGRAQAMATIEHPARGSPPGRARRLPTLSETALHLRQ